MSEKFKGKCFVSVTLRVARYKLEFRDTEILIQIYMPVVLISAFACQPFTGSEPGVGWDTVVNASKFADVILITHPVHRKYIEPELPANVEAHYYDGPFPKALRGNKPGFEAHYFLWQLNLHKYIAQHVHRPFDVVHHVTYGRFWTPSSLYKTNVPFIFGVVGGGETTPSSMFPFFRKKGYMAEAIRNTVVHACSSLPVARKTVSAASIAYVTTQQTAEKLKSMGARDVRVAHQVEITPQKLAYFKGIAQSVNPDPQQLVFISVARPLPWKGIQIGLQAFAEAHLEGSEYWIVATKKERGWLEELAKELRIAHKVKFFGDLPSIEEVHRLIARADVFVHMATHEAYGNVVMEAMSLGKPVICFNNGGPALQVNDQSGWIVDFTDAPGVTQHIVRIMQEVQADRSIAARKGGTAMQQVTDRCRNTPSGEEFLRSAYTEALLKTRQNDVSNVVSTID